MIELTITEDHMKLLNRMYVGWEEGEFGAPAVDCKRPYGNSYVYGDIAEILGIEPEVRDFSEKDFSEETLDKMYKLHKETQDVIQILVQHAKDGIKVGRTYRRVDYKHWKLVD